MTLGKCFDLPEEMVVEIMSWLPPESLIRFKEVSKSWYALIKFLVSDPKFVAKHLSNMKATSLAFVYEGRCTCRAGGIPLFLEHLPYCPLSVLKICRLSHLDDESETDHIHHVIEDLPRIPFERNVTDVLKAHCNGVIALERYDSEESIGILCNPAIMEFRLIPESMLFDDFDVVRAGLGYDSRANDYKMVRFGYDWTLREPRAEIYSLNANSWREIEFDWSEMQVGVDINEVMIDVTGVFCKGFIYWHVCILNDLLDSSDTYHDKLVSFNVSAEIFHGLALPDNLQSMLYLNDSKGKTLSVWNESLALFHYPRESEGAIVIEVWVLDDYFSSWIKQLVVGPLGSIQSALMFWTVDELLMQDKDKSLVSYNVHSQMLRKLAIDGVSKTDEGEECVFPYVKSLFSVKGRRQPKN